MSDALSQMTKVIQPPVYSWLKSLNSYLNDKQSVCNNTDVDNYEFITQVKSFLQVNIDGECCKKYGICGEQFQTDIKFDDSGQFIKASRFRFQHKALTSQKDYIHALRDTRNAIDKIGKKLVPNLDYSDPHMEESFALKSQIDWIDGDSSYKHNKDHRLAYAYSLFYVYY